MEDALRDLQLAMAAHRKALGESRPGRAEAVARQFLLQRLARDVERVCGIEITEMMEAKLARVLSSVAVGELEAWVGRLHRLPAHDPEWLSLIENLTVHETFFHRDRAQLDLLREVLGELVAAAAGEGRRRLRLWSAGCASGEEAYTLAILALSALRDAGWAEETVDGDIVCREPWQLDVLGTDISRVVLTQAQAAVYSTEGLSAFRDLPPELQRFFPVLPKSPETGDVELRGVLPAVKRHVRFRHFNLIARSPPETGFDVVLCRNVLIYLTASARTEVQAHFRQALRPGGVLLLGPTDTPVEPAVYQARWGAGAVAYVLQAQDE
ncbi:MAG TPA: protein-glutamate O-methyltransferase CheR [Stellaceae bacterium]|nr:protein-glutamate O-methyltransferase CheR [Stellaceae bacterium]